MPKDVLLDEFRVGVFVRRELPTEGVADVRRALAARKFRSALRKAIRETCRRFSALAHVRISVTQ